MPDVFSKEKRSEIMSRIRSKNTLIERTVFLFLKQQKLYFQIHYKRAAGQPDIALPRKKRALFLDGDFWHGRDYNARSKKLSHYWKTKIADNIKRDKKNYLMLKKQGWGVLRVWERDIEKNKEKTLKMIYNFLNK